MTALAARLAALFLMLLVVLPAAGPLMDHHFAERQFGHVHLSIVPGHSHAEQLLHVHTNDGNTAAEAGAVALVRQDSAWSAAFATPLADTGDPWPEVGEPGLNPVMPHQPVAVARQACEAPPTPPPQHLS